MGYKVKVIEDDKDYKDMYIESDKSKYVARVTVGKGANSLFNIEFNILTREDIVLNEDLDNIATVKIPVDLIKAVMKEMGE